MEKFITKFFAKSVHVILQSRSPYFSTGRYNVNPFISSTSSSPSSNIRPLDEWFNLALKDRPAALDNIDMWRQNNLEPLVIDIVLDSWKPDCDASRDSHGGLFVRNLSSGRGECGHRSRSEKIVERWIVQYESQSINQPRMEIMFRKAYRRIAVLLRSLYTMVRLLPAYKLFRDLHAPRQTHSFILFHRISSFAEPFSREEDAEMSQHDFGPLDLFFGKLSVSVAYLKTLEDVSLGPSTPISIEFVMDYVGSPLVCPLKRLPYLPTAVSAPSYASFCRRYGWSNDHGDIPSYSPTPSPTYDFQALDHNLSPCIPSRHPLPENSTSPCSITQVSFSGHASNLNECRPSPSSSQSCPTHLNRVFLHSESAPVSITLPRQEGSDRGQNQGLSPSPYNKTKRQARASQLDTLRTQENTLCAFKRYTPENKLQLKMESLRLMKFQTELVQSKIESAGKDGTGYLTGLKSPSTPPRTTSRSPNRLFFMDDFDDSAMTSCRVESANTKDIAENLCHTERMRIRSLDAIVGEFIMMLRSAPPLQLNNSNTIRPLQVFNDKVSSQKTQLGKTDNNKEHDLNKVNGTSDLCKLMTAADSFKELQNYKNIRELILKRRGSRLQNVEHIAKSDSRDSSKDE